MIVFEGAGWDDYLSWQQNDRQVLRKINQLIHDIQRDPWSGLGKPEALKDNLAGFWSRRITDEHRIVYRIEDDDLIVAQCRGHNDD
ncbi:Txe/YoeB family addiction module toxin [Ottowia testudinis]|uniref:Putative mRNA interferase YoeB n=1 Tax=Ottowia testudinis TaxID=2816950 RepID=A0A975H269_9BURK|nr:Txe/YoeB family addiction module toxin [Ottowia testudinis]QTD43876.1 Txe/YoeB family addiction module toxin [Ottowia testudinis]